MVIERLPQAAGDIFRVCFEVTNDVVSVNETGVDKPANTC